ncbi:MAG: permease [Verrucomicrobiales bacterium]|nr:permease [Verrucomicrobiales bacterium]
MPDWKPEIKAHLAALNLDALREAEIVEELSQHLDDRFEEWISSGNSEHEARCLTLREINGTELLATTLKKIGGRRRSRSYVPAISNGSFMQNFFQDFRYGLRALARNPSFTAVAILTLALGIGANTAIFSVVNGVLLKPLPYLDPGQIVTVLHNGTGPVNPADFLDWRAQNTSFERMAAAEFWGGTLTDSDRPEAVDGIRFGEGLFDLLGVQPFLGRTFQADDYQPGHERVLVLSHSLWRRRFGANPSVIGQAVTLDTQTYNIIGVMPRDFRFTPFWATKSEMCAPLSLVDRANNRGGNSLRIFGRLKTGVTRTQAQTDMDGICKRLEQAYPDSNTGYVVRVDRLIDKTVGNVRLALMILLGAVVFVLLIACVNVANLLLVRAASREKEMAIRAALGAGRWRAVRQLLTESLLLACLASGVGLVFGFLGVHALKTFLAGSSSGFAVQLTRVHEIALDGPTLLFTLALTLLTGVIFGLVPAVRAARPDLQETLKESGRGSSAGRRSGNFRSVLIITEVALALIMLVAAGLLMRSFVRLAAIDPGFKPNNVLTMIVSLSGQQDFVGPKREAFYEQVLQKIEALPGVEAASAINHLPLAGDLWDRGISIQGRPLPPPGEGIGAVYRVSRPKYFSTMGIPLLSGRDFNNRDRSESPGVVIINEELAKREFPREDPVGKRITLDDPRKNPTWLTIAGVVKNSKQASWSGMVDNEIYLPWLQSRDFVEGIPRHFAGMTLVIRTAITPRTIIPSVQNVIWSLNKDAPLSSITTLEEVVSNAVWQQRFNLILIGLFAALALILASVGIYGVMAFTVAQRTQELGIRLALGAQRIDLIRLVVGQGMRLTLIGVVVGLAGAFAVTRLMATLLYQVKTHDAATFFGVALLLAGVAFLACWLPARRASQVDPIEALRCE